MSLRPAKPTPAEPAETEHPGRDAFTGWEPGEERSFSVRRDSPLARLAGAFHSSGLAGGGGRQPTALPSNSEQAFAQVILAIRWGCLTISLALAGLDIATGDTRLPIWCAVLLFYTTGRTLRPTPMATSLQSVAFPLAEVIFLAVAVGATGRWSSPLILVLISTIVVLGFRSGLRWGIGGSLAASMFIIGFDYLSGDPHPLAVAGQWMVQLVLVALVTGYARAVTGEARRQHSIALDRLGRLSDANALLFSLHRVAQTLPASLDLAEVLDSTVTRLRSLLAVDRLAIFIFEEADASWEVIRQDGLALDARLGPTSLIEPLRLAIVENRIVERPDLGGRGLDASSESGLYTVLRARGAVIGLLAIESTSPVAYSGRDVKMLSGFVEPMALAIDNGRWFRRLRTVGADEERTRIARDLHDRIGQSLAFVAFELDRITKRESKGERVGEELDELRTEVRTVIGEVRETLYDLRTDVNDRDDFVTVMRGFASRVADRSELNIECQFEADARLPILQEREMWRIAQESLTNVERHAKAENVTITWRCDGTSATVRVVDDGEGFEGASAGRMDSYGIVGMRERAASVGAILEFDSTPGEGTAVTCRLGTSEVNTLDPQRLLKDVPVSADRNGAAGVPTTGLGESMDSESTRGGVVT